MTNCSIFIPSAVASRAGHVVGSAVLAIDVIAGHNDTSGSVDSLVYGNERIVVDASADRAF